MGYDTELAYMLEERLLETMVCPVCKGGVGLKGMFLVCDSCGIAYAIADDVPLMLVSESWPLKEAAKKNFIHHLRL